MDSGKRSRNFTEREKMLLIEVAKEFVSIIDNKKTDGTTVEAKKQAWMALTKKYNAVSETGVRTEKQLHALYDNLKKKARKNLSDDKCEMYKTGGGTFSPKTTVIDEKVVTLLTPQFKPLSNDFDSSAPYYNIDTETNSDMIIVLNAEDEKENSLNEMQSTSKLPLDVESTPKIRKTCLTETKRKNIENISTSIIKRKKQKQINEDDLTSKKLEILELQRKNEDAVSSKKLEILDIQRQQELDKLEKNKILLELDIELKKVLLENAKMDLEFKKKNFSL